MKKDVTQQLINFMSKHPIGVTNKQLARHFKVTVGGLSKGSTTRVSVALFDLIKKGDITMEQAMTRKGKPNIYLLSQGAPTPAFNVQAVAKKCEARDALIKAIDSYVELKQQETKSEIIQNLANIIKK